MDCSRTTRILASISPSLARIFTGLACLIGMSAPSFAGPLQEADITRLARQHSPSARVLAERVALQKSVKSGTALRANPQLSWQRQTQSDTESENSLVLTMPLNRTRKQNVSRALAGIGVEEARSNELLGGAKAVRRALELFYSCLAQEKRVVLAEGASLRLTEAARVITRRREEGQLSGYDVARVELALELARSQVGEAGAVLASLRAELALRIGVQRDSLVLRGALWPVSEAHWEAQAMVEDSPSLVALRSAAGHAQRAEKRAHGMWLPTLSATAGLRIVSAEQVDYGYVAGLSLSLPIWTGSTALQSQASSRTRELSARKSAIRAEREIRSAAALQNLLGLRKEAERFELATRRQTTALKRAVESGYREGQRSLLELLDASETLTSVRTRLLDLHLSAKQAELTLRDARGEFE